MSDDANGGATAPDGADDDGGGECGAEVGRRLSATLKQSSSARHWSGCAATAAAADGCDRRHARLSRPYGGGAGCCCGGEHAGLSSANATWSGVTCA
ncbi:Os04g0298850 [Oryza sativa Japonica Group]|uniref:Os04g0298850 protein n=1 Tax=Oryza sativa subsp. japonica TaxID=39947 RepID=A0A0P0W883_ORYSJ|nr:Os04g0298850 [Oryza sativa Japonica Group]